MRRSGGHGFTLIELLVVIGILVLIISILLPTLSNARKQSEAVRMRQEQRMQMSGAGAIGGAVAAGDAPAANAAVGPVTQPVHPPAAVVRDFTAKIDLTPRLSVGTVEAESIYEARLAATIDAVGPAGGSDTGECEIRLPLPPQVISLADLSVTVNGEPSDAVTLRDGAVVWTGHLAGDDPAAVKVTFTAVGKGLYQFETPPGKILDTFDLQLTANGSDVRMLELSLQPTSMSRTSGRTTYGWNYKRLVFGRPISVDVLGVAPVDRLGELRWLGPLSVGVFGLIVGLYAHAHGLTRFDRWMLVLVLGAYTGAYPLMYFAQEFVALSTAIVASAAIVLAIIAVRAVTVIGVRHAVLGVLLPAVGTMSVTLVIATHPALQGILLTAGALAVFVVAMLLIPRVKWMEGTAGVVGPRVSPA